MKTRSSSPTLGAQNEKKDASIASEYWRLYLRGTGWKRVASKTNPWCFIPAQYDVQNMSELKKAGGPDLPTPRRVSFSPQSRSDTTNPCSPEEANTTNPCSPEEPKNSNIPFDEMKIHQGNQDTKETLTSSLTEEVWGHGGNNLIPYRHLETVLANDKSYIFVGYLNGEICSLFVYEFTGLKKRDATIRVYWTKNEHRKKGFVTKLMHEGLCFLVDDAVLHSGSTSPDGILVSRSQEFDEYTPGHFSSVISNLREHIQSSITKKITGDRNGDFHFGFKLSEINTDDDDNDIIAIYESNRKKVESPKFSEDRKRSHEESEVGPEDTKEKRVKISTGGKRSHDPSQGRSEDEKGGNMQKLTTLQEKENKLESKLKTLREEEESKFKTLQEEEKVLESKLKKEDDDETRKLLSENFKKKRDHIYMNLKSLQRRIERYEDWLDDITQEY